MLPNDLYNQLFLTSPRQWRYTPAVLKDFNAWSARVSGKVRELLRADRWPATPVSVRVENREECGDFSRERIALDAGPLFSVSAYLLIPKRRAGKTPAVICMHGHGGYFAGKDMVAGISAPPTHPIAVECAEALNYGFGVQLVKEGFITLCPDGFNFGERVFENDRWAQRDLCPDYFPPLALFGYCSLGITLGSLKLLLDYLQTRGEVDAGKIGCVGLSYGGIVTLYFTAIEPRIRAAVVSGGLSSCQSMLEHDKGHICAGQLVPGMMEWFDKPDVAMAIAPRPVFYEIMRRDSCFDFERCCETWQRVAEVYAALGVRDRIGLETPDTDHRYSGIQVPDFFRRHLV